MKERCVFAHLANLAKVQYSNHNIKKRIVGLLNSVTSGEGIVNRFSGSGKVYVCSRSRSGFFCWISSALKLKKSR
ncbi:MAG: AIM24 family protein [Desulfuromonadaceae bacterium]